MSADPAADGTPRGPHAGSLGDEAPSLTIEQIKKELERLHASARRDRRSALFASLADPNADGATLSAPVQGKPETFRIVSTSGELDLRCKLAREDETVAAVYIVPFARQLPRDLEAVLANGRVHIPLIESLLPTRFGAKSATPRLLHSRLRVLAQHEATRMYGRGDAPSIDLDDAWIVLLRDRLGIDALENETQLFGAVLQDRDRRGKALSGLLAQVKGAREELAAVLERRMGTSAPHVLSAWLDDTTVELAAMAVVGEATRTVLAEGQGTSFALLTTAVEMRVAGMDAHPLKAIRDAAGSAGLAKALVDLGYLVNLVWQRIDDPANEHALRRAILGEAEKVLVSEQVRPIALGSNRLPFVFEHRRRELVRALDSSDGGAVDRATAALLAHESAHSDPMLEEQVEMGARLTAFLAQAIPPVQESPRAELIQLAEFQAATGGYVDWARQIARHDHSTDLGKALHRVTTHADGVRDALDARFAQAYAKAVGQRGDRSLLRDSVQVAGRGAKKLLLIEDAIAEVALELLERDSSRKLLVLCMDGMSWANLAELWTTSKTSLVPVRSLPVLAHVPTVTKVSRSALFAGRTIAPGESLDTGRDPDRLSKHASIVRMRESSVVLLRGDILAKGGGLSDDARNTVEGDGRIVAVVVNAIDDQLSGASQLRVSISLDKIPALKALLVAAESTGRLVLLVSDHGNISSHRFYGMATGSTSKDVDGATHGARYRYLAEREVAREDEIELPAGALSVGKSDRLAVAVKETLRYSHLLHAGEHGGASLAEAIAPAVLLAPRTMVKALRDTIDAGIPLDPPDFWHRPADASSRLPAVAPPSPAPRPSPPAAPIAPIAPSSSQGTLALGSEASVPNLAERLFRAKLYTSRLRTEIAEKEHLRVRQAIEILVHNGGRMARDPFAVALGIDMAGRGSRVPGFLSLLERVLNVDQELVIEMEGQVIRLDEALLRSIFFEESSG